MRQTAYIYTLADPRTGEIRYVGKTFCMRKRFYDHICCKNKRNNKRTAWIKSLLKDGLKPKMEVLETIENASDEDWAQCEMFWISTLKFYGCDLVNGDSGGLSGKKQTPETIAKRLANTKPRIYTQEERDRIGARSKAAMTTEVRARLSVISRRLKHTEESKKKISESKLGRPKPESVRVALLEGSRQWKLSQGFTPNIICVSCNKVIKVNKLKSGQPNDKQKWFVAGVGYIHNLCLKKSKNSHSANGCITSAVTTS